MGFSRAALSAAFALSSLTAMAADYPAPKQGDWIAKDFKFHTGETMPELRLHYTTVGEPSGQPVLVLHGSGGRRCEHADARTSPASCSAPASRSMRRNTTSSFPTASATANPSKPSDGMKTAFPKYNYEDMVDAHYRLVKEGLGVKHLRLVIGNSMGGMHSWIWGGEISAGDGRAGADGVAADRDGGAQLDAAADDAGNHPQRSGLQSRQLHHPAAHDEIRHQRLWHRDCRRHLAYQMLAPTAAKADKMVDDRLAVPVTADANDFIYQWEASRDYNPSAGTGKDRGDAAGDQRRRRRAQPAGNRRHRCRDEAHQERPALSDPGQHRDPRPSHHRQCEVLCQAAAGIAADGAAADDVNACGSEPCRRSAFT